MIAQISVVYMDAESSNLKEIMVFDGKTVVQARELPSSDLAINRNVITVPVLNFHE